MGSFSKNQRNHVYFQNFVMVDEDKSEQLTAAMTGQTRPRFVWAKYTHEWTEVRMHTFQKQVDISSNLLQTIHHILIISAGLQISVQAAAPILARNAKNALAAWASALRFHSPGRSPTIPFKLSRLLISVGCLQSCCTEKRVQKRQQLLNDVTVTFAACWWSLFSPPFPQHGPAWAAGEQGRRRWKECLFSSRAINLEPLETLVRFRRYCKRDAVLRTQLRSEKKNLWLEIRKGHVKKRINKK